MSLDTTRSTFRKKRLDMRKAKKIKRIKNKWQADKIQHTIGVAKESQSSGIVQIFTIQESF